MGLLDNEYPGPEYNVPVANSAGYEPAKTTSTGYDPGSYQAQGYTAKESDWRGYTADERQTDPNALISSQMTKLMGQDSPYRTQFETGAKQQANARGMLNSQMAVSGGQAAAAQGLLPVAQGDAGTIANQNLTNQQYGNRAREYGASAYNQAQVQNQQAINTAKQFSASEGNRAASESYLQRARAGEFGAEAQNQANVLNQAATNRSSEFGADAVNRANQQWADQIGSLISAQQAGEINEWINQQSQVRQQEIMTLEADIRERLAAVDQRYAIQLETLKQNYNINEHLLDQSGSYYKDTMLAITELLSNTELTPEQQQQGLNDQMAMLSAGLEFFQTLSPTTTTQTAEPVIPTLTGESTNPS